MDILWILLGAAALIALASIRQVNQYERGVKFTLDASAGAMSVVGAEVLKAYKASNGYVYVIDKVLADVE